MFGGTLAPYSLPFVTFTFPYFDMEILANITNLLQEQLKTSEDIHAPMYFNRQFELKSCLHYFII